MDALLLVAGAGLLVSGFLAGWKTCLERERRCDFWMGMEPWITEVETPPDLTNFSDLRCDRREGHRGSHHYSDETLLVVV